MLYGLILMDRLHARLALSAGGYRAQDQDFWETQASPMALAMYIPAAIILAFLISQIAVALAAQVDEGQCAHAHSLISHQLVANGWCLHRAKKYNQLSVAAAQLQAPRLIHATNPASTKATGLVVGHC
jgi:hypothetical protein